MDTLTMLLPLLLVLAYPISIVAAMTIFRMRAGMTTALTGADWREFAIPNPGWFLLHVLKSMVWPFVLFIWLVSGLPTSRWRAVSRDGDREVRRVLRVRG